MSYYRVYLYKCKICGEIVNLVGKEHEETGKYNEGYHNCEEIRNNFDVVTSSTHGALEYIGFNERVNG